MATCGACTLEIEDPGKYCSRCGAPMPRAGEVPQTGTAHLQGIFRDAPEPSPVRAPLPVATLVAPRPVPVQVRPTPAQLVRHPGRLVVAVALLLVVGGAAWLVLSQAAVPVAAGTPGPAVSPTGSVTANVNQTPAALPAGAKICQPGVARGGSASCDFAVNVAKAVWAIEDDLPASFEVTASSPVTKKDYDLACVNGAWIECRGGSAAIIYVLANA